ncbi:MAG: response regulator transcription factor [Ruminococcus sp.]|jgi:DNA-binding response OmpR family regulator
MKTILIVEDDRKLNHGILLALKSEYSCAQAFSVGEAEKMYGENRFDLILLDVNLPDGSGIDFLVKIRERDQVPVILLTVNKMEMDIVSGLELGANDYITKPFSLMVLRARVGVQLRQGKQEEDIYRTGEFFFDFKKMEFLKSGAVLELSRTEQRLLRCLVENKGKNVSRSRLIDQVWPGDTEFVDDHALSVVVNRLREKLGVGQEYIKTAYGVGYTWMER